MLTGPLWLRAAELADSDTLARWRADAAAWIAHEHHSTQWSKPFNAQQARSWIEHGATVMAMLEPGGEPVAGRTVLPVGDPFLWTPEERAAPARYLAKLVVDRRYTGRGIGRLLTDWARRRAHRAGAEIVRINVWTDNPGLHTYHRRYGWRRVRTEPGHTSGTLFAMPVLHDPFPSCVQELGTIVLPGD
ncbi:GNAT family N-acetyltransferase [Amycolatopsis sp. NPDC059021]|uniref:GNAT family N-acetyltransferase n=1 Tax=Amycolatopsis sp. NPDC059021 TaxID=3346704 RepID=UPI00366F3280